jgi:hypothetical protein
MVEKVIVKETKNNVKVVTPGPQGPRGKTILNGAGTPANNLGLQGDFYYNTTNTYFYGPKPTDLTWDGANSYPLQQLPAEFSLAYPWEMAQVHNPDSLHPNVYWVEIQHNLNFHPNVTVKTSSGDVLETGIDYNSINKITLTMAQPFSGTAYLS